MKGITPVIAIILLLLMAVAAAGGFYFVYQGFTESGEESGATQIEQLGEQSLAQIQIESAAGGRIYVRNVGASDIDLSKATVYVENQPVSVNRSADTLAERSRAVLKLTEVPGCTQEQCEVKISGAASTSKSIDLSRLLCSSDADCYSGESCEGGVCIEEEGGEAAFCGDGTCDYPSETGESCYEDCGIENFLGQDIDLSGGDVDSYLYEWDGSTYVKGENHTANSWNDGYTGHVYDSQGNALAIGVAGNEGTLDLSYSYWDGSSWSASTNFTSTGWTEETSSFAWDFNSSDEAMVLWEAGEDLEGRNVAWASFDGSWHPENGINLTDNEGTVVNMLHGPAFRFDENDKGMLVFSSYATSGGTWLNYSEWDGGWGDVYSTILSVEDPALHRIRNPVFGFNSTHGLAVWRLEYSYLSKPKDVIQWATWDGFQWSEPQNYSDDLGGWSVGALFLDESETWVLGAGNTTADPAYYKYFTWESGGSGFVDQGNFTDDNIAAGMGFLENHYGAVLGLMVESGPGGVDYNYTYWDGSGWTEPVAVTS